MPREAKTKLCRCGRGKIFTDHRRMYNGKDAQGRQVCSECKIDEILSPFTEKDQ